MNAIFVTDAKALTIGVGFVTDAKALTIGVGFEQPSCRNPGRSFRELTRASRPDLIPASVGIAIRINDGA